MSKLAELQTKKSELQGSYYAACDAYNVAANNLNTAQQSYNDVLTSMSMLGDSISPNDPLFDELSEAKEALDKAQEEMSEAEEAYQAEKEKYDAVSGQIFFEKFYLKATRLQDKSLVVVGAMSRCSYAEEESMLLLDKDHGVYTKQIPQLTVNDAIVEENVVNFGTCKSPENPSVIEAAEKVAEDAYKKKLENKGWFENPKEVEVNDEILSQCVGKCVEHISLAGNVIWQKGSEVIRVNGGAALLRRCDLCCKYGGHITLLLSGQPGEE